MSQNLVQTYSHIAENRGITMASSFLRLISWKSPPQSIKFFVKLDLFHKCFGCLVWFCLHWKFWEQQLNTQEKKWHFGFDSGKNVNFKLIGEHLFMISISKIMMPLWFPGFLLYVDKFERVLVTGEKFTVGGTAIFKDSKSILRSVGSTRNVFR